jgi:putative aldouronate transport system substrate-binding protein
MKCPNCQKEIKDGALFCTFCGSKIKADGEVDKPKSEQEKSKNKSGGKKGLIAAIAVIAVVAVAGASVAATAYFVGKNDKDVLASKDETELTTEDKKTQGEDETENIDDKTGQGSYVANPDKPDTIKLIADTCITEDNGLDEVCEEYKRQTGIKLEVEKPEHNTYYESVALAFTSGDTVDAVELGSNYYPTAVNKGWLWDMSDAWEQTTANAKSIINEDYVDALKIDGKLYGFPKTRGNGTITYVRQDWLDKIGMSEGPKDYDEFINMLTQFKGLSGVTPNGEAVIPYTAAGLINTAAPYELYLREFYWQASPDFIKNDSGEYVDGFTTPEFQAALQRIKSAYQAGLIDAEITTNETDAARKKVTLGVCGTFNYWAGAWDAKLEDSLVKIAPNAKLTAIPPIKETYYIERIPTAMAISASSENPSGVFEYLIMYSHDGGEGQMLFTHGVDGVHYKKDGVSYSNLEGKNYDRKTTGNGETVALGYFANPFKDVEKTFYEPEISITNWDDPIAIDDRATTSLATFSANRVFATVPVTSDVIEQNLSDVDSCKRSVADDFVLNYDMTIEEAMAEYQEKAGDKAQIILDELNS